MEHFHDMEHCPRLSKVFAWVETHGLARLTLEHAAAVAGVEPHYFSSLFRKKVGVTFSAWRLRQRVSVAQTLLRKDVHSIAQIAEAVGYKDSRSLERASKTLSGLTPATFKSGVVE